VAPRLSTEGAHVQPRSAHTGTIGLDVVTRVGRERVVPATVDEDEGIGKVAVPGFGTTGRGKNGHCQQ
jgi:hypothetical protein